MYFLKWYRIAIINDCYYYCYIALLILSSLSLRTAKEINIYFFVDFKKDFMKFLRISSQVKIYSICLCFAFLKTQMVHNKYSLKMKHKQIKTML